MSQSMYTIIWAISVLQVLIGEIKCADLPAKEWWETTLVYQIWPRGFYDSDGDGEGDLRGIIHKLNYIEDLGVETIWLNPIYASPLVDAGYDVSNYTDINPLFGDFTDFDTLVQELHDRDLKIILDMIPNHSSNKHKWFSLSVQNVDPYKDYYIWSEGSVDETGNKIPPNNWVSMYNEEEAGSAWTWNDVRQQWYYHKFHESQPDLNLRNNIVIDEFLEIFKFWLERNVDGFRIGAVPYFFEDENLLNEPSTGHRNATWGLKESTELLYKFRAHINNWVEENNASTKLLIAESDESDRNLIAYYGNATHEGIPPINIRFINPIHNKTYANYIKDVIDEWFQLLPGNVTTNWVLSNHDFSRVPSRIGLNRVDGLHMLSLLLPGQAYTYYGEEIAMLDANIPWERTIDPMGCARTKDTYESFSRDPARTPMQWNAEVSAGFSTNETTYLPVNPEYTDRNVEIQQTNERSNLKTYKKLTELRKEPVFTHGNYELQTANDNRILILKRSLEDNPVYIIIVNLWIRQENIDLTSLYPNISDDLEIVIASTNAIYNEDTVPKDNILLTANAALVLKGKIEAVNTDEPITITSTAITTPPNDTTKNESSSTESTTPTDIITENNTVVTENNTVTTENNTVETENSTVTTENNTVVTEDNTVTTENNTITTENNTVETENNTITTENNTVTTENNTVETENSTVTTENSTVTTENNTVTTENNTVETENSTVTTENSTVTTENNTITTENNTIETENSTVTTENSTVTTENNTVVTEKNTVTTENNTVETENSTVTTENNTVVTEKNTVTTENNTVETEITQINSTEKESPITEPEPSITTILPVNITTESNSAGTSTSTFVLVLSTASIVTILPRFLNV